MRRIFLLCSLPLLASGFACTTSRALARDRCCGRASPARLGLFDFLEPDPEAEAEKERQFREQQAILARRRNPQARREDAEEVRARRADANKAAEDKIAWQRDPNADPLLEFRRRKEAGTLEKIGYEDEPTGGIPMPMASFGVGGEFGQGGKYDNGARFDLRLPYAEQVCRPHPLERRRQKQLAPRP